MTRSASSPDLPALVRQAFLDAGFPPGLSLCLGFSGGLDSRVLLDLLASLRGELSFSLSAVHVHHGLSPHADAWASFCAAEAAALGVPCEVVRVHVDREHPAGLEAAARAARQRVLAEQACQVVALAHHRDDQAETLLFRLLRGTGVHGAAAMPRLSGASPRRWRPLLQVPRAQLEAHARARGLSWVEDESNGDPAFRRNFLRHRVLPQLGEAFPGASAVLAREAELFGEAAQLLDELAWLDLQACGAPAVDRRALCALSRPRLCNALRLLLSAAGGRIPSRTRLLEAARQLGEVAPASAWRVALGGAALCLYRERVWCESLADAGGLHEQWWQGEGALPWGAGRVVFEPAVGAPALRLLHGARLAPRTPGLTLQPGPGRPRQALRKLCQQAAIPPWWRERLPVLWVDDVPVWVGGLGGDAAWACGEDEAGVVPRWEPGAPGSGPLPWG